jgi:hypothetical protein
MALAMPPSLTLGLRCLESQRIPIVNAILQPGFRAACRFGPIVLALLLANVASATPANKAALEKHYDKFLARELARCTTCHLPSDNKNPESLDDFPHNPFGVRLRAVGKELVAVGKRKDIPTRLQLVAHEDSDHDGVDNETELLLAHNPGDSKGHADEERVV